MRADLQRHVQPGPGPGELTQPKLPLVTPATQDLSGPLLCELAGAEPGLEVVASKVVPDTAAEIRRALVSWADSGTADIILTTGGTGGCPQ